MHFSGGDGFHAVEPVNKLDADLLPKPEAEATSGEANPHIGSCVACFFLQSQLLAAQAENAKSRETIARLEGRLARQMGLCEIEHEALDAVRILRERDSTENASLRAQVEAMAKVVDAVRLWKASAMAVGGGYHHVPLRFYVALEDALKALDGAG